MEVGMTLHSPRFSLIAALTVTACLLLTAPIAMADKGAYKLEGAWVAKVVGFPGQWSYVVAADPSGTRAYGHGSIDLGFSPSAFGCDLGRGNADSPILISLRMTAPDTAVAYSVWYALKTEASGATEIVYIGEVRSETKFVSPGKGEATHYFAFYRPSQDVDPADRFPDKGEIPACSAPVPIYTLDTRIPAP
jgi:hypothetical protein